MKRRSPAGFNAPISSRLTEVDRVGAEGARIRVAGGPVGMVVQVGRRAGRRGAGLQLPVGKIGRLRDDVRRIADRQLAIGRVVGVAGDVVRRRHRLQDQSVLIIDGGGDFADGIGLGLLAVLRIVGVRGGVAGAVLIGDRKNLAVAVVGRADGAAGIGDGDPAIGRWRRAPRVGPARARPRNVKDHTAPDTPGGNSHSRQPTSLSVGGLHHRYARAA